MPFGSGTGTSLRIAEEIRATGGRAAWIAASYPSVAHSKFLIQH
jgi:hypothetical protein